jgi:preprotein translocase subunit SecF
MSKIKKDFDFIGKRKIFFGISISLMIIGLFVNIFMGVKLDISFKGGTLVKYSYQGTLDREKVESFIESKLKKDVSVQISDAAADANNVLNVSLTESLSMAEQKSLNDAIVTEYKENKLEQLGINSLSPTMGKLFFLKCIVAIGLASIFLVIYVALRFRKIGGLSAGAMALVALLHDVLIAYFAFVVFRIPLNDNFVAVVLSILGYSLNDTIVIYDRIRENRKSMEKGTPIGTIVNKSINQSFTRSFNTSLCTFLAIGTVAVLAVAFNLESIASFAVPMMVGVISGCYSTVCICGPLWVMWQDRKAKKELSNKSNTKKIKA